MVDGKDKKGMTLVIAVGGKPPKSPTDTAKPDMKKAFDAAWSVVKAIPEANAHGLGAPRPDTGLPSYDERRDTRKLPHTMETSSAEPLQSFDVDDKLDLENDLNQGRAEYMDGDMAHSGFRGNIAEDYRPQDSNEGNEEYYRGLLEEMLRGKISGRKDMAHDPELLQDYDQRHGQIMDGERRRALNNMEFDDQFEPSAPEQRPPSDIGTMSPRNIERFRQGMGPSSPF